MKILHICAGWQKWNGAANIARLIMGEQERRGHTVSFCTWASICQLRSADEVWIHVPLVGGVVGAECPLDAGGVL